MDFDGLILNIPTKYTSTLLFVLLQVSLILLVHDWSCATLSPHVLLQELQPAELCDFGSL